MKVKKLLYHALFVSIYCAPSFCMQQNNFDADQIHTLLARMRENPDSFSALSRDIAHQLYLQNPNITRGALRAFFRDGKTIENPILPKEIINRIWKFIEPLKSMKKLIEGFIQRCWRNARDTHVCCAGYESTPDCCIDFDREFGKLCKYEDRDINNQNDYLFNGDPDYDHFIRIRLWYGTSHAILLFVNDINILIIPDIPYIQGVTTGEELIRNIFESFKHGQLLTDRKQAQQMVEQLDISNY